jgi:uncharacterized membrane protein YgcG
MLKNNRPQNNRLKNNKPRATYARAKWLALGSIVVVAALLNMVLHDWIASLHLAVVIVFTLITVGLAVHTVIAAAVNRSGRKGEDPDGSGGGPGGPGGPGRGPADPEITDPVGYRDDFGLAA